MDKPNTQVFSKSLWNKLRHGKDREAEATFDQRVDSQNLDVVCKTGRDHFVIKDFKDQVVTSDELKKFLDMLLEDSNRLRIE